MDEPLSTKTGEPIATVSADDPSAFALGLGYKILVRSARNGSMKAKALAIG